MTKSPKIVPDAAEMAAFRHIVAEALKEDIGAGDITSELLIDASAQGEMRFAAREILVVCGLPIIQLVYEALDAKVQVVMQATDGDTCQKDSVLATAKGNMRSLLAGERVALNLLQRMSGVATLTRRYVNAMQGTKAVLLDTRKTMPLLRAADKYAVRAGGGQNHRMRLDDMILIKDNHLASNGDIAAAIRKARENSKLPIVVECDTLEQVKAALEAKPDRILLDNMNTEMLRKAVALAQGSVPVEASGAVTLETVKAVAETGVDFISVGSITHSAASVDIGADAG